MSGWLVAGAWLVVEGRISTCAIRRVRDPQWQVFAARANGATSQCRLQLPSLLTATSEEGVPERVFGKYCGICCGAIAIPSDRRYHVSVDDEGMRRSGEAIHPKSGSYVEIWPIPRTHYGGTWGPTARQYW